MNIESFVVFVVVLVSAWAIIVASSRNSLGEWKFKDPFRP